MSKVTVVSAEVTPRLKLNLIASAPITAGDVVTQCVEDEIQSQRTWRTIQVDFDRHVKNEFLDYMDHSCEPNTVFDIESLSFIALRDIAEGESVTFFYPGSEVELAQGFRCQCGSPNCLGSIRGAFYLTPDQMRWVLEQGYCTSFMRAQLRRLLER